MKINTTIMDIMQSELILDGHNEFLNKNKLTLYDDKYSFIKKVMTYDEDVERLANRIIFNGVSLDNPEHDRIFKKTFLNRFLNRQIGFQTTEAFSSQVMYTILVNFEFITMVYDKMKDFVYGQATSKSNDKSIDTSDNRHLTTSLPQNQVNLNVDNTQLAYGDSNNISRTKNDKQSNHDSSSQNMNIENLIKSKGLLEEVFNDIDRKCFLQIF